MDTENKITITDIEGVNEIFNKKFNVWFRDVFNRFPREAFEVFNHAIEMLKAQEEMYITDKYWDLSLSTGLNLTVSFGIMNNSELYIYVEPKGRSSEYFFIVHTYVSRCNDGKVIMRDETMTQNPFDDKWAGETDDHGFLI